jgi:hypothetical protein
MLKRLGWTPYRYLPWGSCPENGKDHQRGDVFTCDDVRRWEDFHYYRPHHPTVTL